MKKMSVFLAATCLGLMFSACGSSQKVANSGDLEVIVPCSGPEYESNDEFFRANGMGLSTDMSIAKKKALSNVRELIAQNVEATVKSVVDNYYSSYQNGERDESKQRFEGMARTAANQTLKGVRTICEKTMKAPDGNYKVYIAMEMKASNILDAISSQIKDDEKLRTDFEYEQFKKVFEEEMSKAK